MINVVPPTFTNIPGFPLDQFSILATVYVLSVQYHTVELLSCFLITLDFRIKVFPTYTLFSHEKKGSHPHVYSELNLSSEV